MTIFSISNNSVGEKAADDIAIVLSLNMKLVEVDLYNKNFQTLCAIRITNAISNIVTLTNIITFQSITFKQKQLILLERDCHGLLLAS